MANTTCGTWVNTSGEAETQAREIIEEATWLKEMTLWASQGAQW